MLQLQHLLPPNCKPIVPGLSANVKKFMPTLVEKVAAGWAPIPESQIETLLVIEEMVPCLAFRKNKQEVYIHVFGFDLESALKPLGKVHELYYKYKLGDPEFPRDRNWIHTIPLPGSNLNPKEILLIHEITHSLFWSVYMDLKRIKSKK